MSDYASGFSEYRQRIYLANILGAMPKKELLSLCRTHGISGYSGLDRAALMSLISEYILNESVIYNYFICMNDFEIEYVRMARADEGVIDEAEPEAFTYMVMGGYAGMTKELDFGIPWEVMEIFERIDGEDFEEKRHRICLIGNYCHLANHLYGVTPPMEVVKIFNRYEKKKTDWEEVVGVYHSIAKYRCDFIYKDEFFVDTDFKYDYRDLLEIQGDIPYFMPEEEQIREWFAFGFQLDHSEYGVLFRYLMEQLWVKEHLAADACFCLENSLHVGCTLDCILEAFNDMGIVCRTKRQCRELKDILVNLMENTRMLIYRGHTPSEMRFQLN